MMSRKFTTREVILLLICAVLFLGIFYYEVVWKDTVATIAENDTTGMEQELLLAETKAQQMATMQAVIDESKDTAVGTMAPYNNLQNEITELNSILSGATSYNITFADATTDGTVVRRDASVSYHTNKYKTAKKILKALHDCKYKCLIQDVNMAATASSADAKKGIQKAGDIDISVTVTFYEMVTDASINAGLAEYAPQ